MPNTHPNTKFLPSQETLRAWLGTRKNEKFKGITLKGLFQTSDFARDSILTIVAVVADISCIGVLMYLGRFNVLIIIVGIILVLIDLIGAFLVHVRVAKKKAVDNLKMLHTQQVIKDKDEASLKGMLLLWEVVGYILIAISCIVKVFGIYVLGKGAAAIIIGFIILYVVIAYIHANITGYFIWEIIVDIKFRREYKKMKQGNNRFENKGVLHYYFVSKNELIPVNHSDTRLDLEWYSKSLDTKRFGGIEEIKYSTLLDQEMKNLKGDSEDSKSIYNAVLNNIYENKTMSDEEKLKSKLYKFSCSGIPIDADIEHIIDSQANSENKWLVARKGLRYQLMFLGYKPDHDNFQNNTKS